MDTKRQEIDSEVFGGTVLSIEEFDGTKDFGGFEEEYRRRDHPLYVTCKIPAEAIGDVHALEAHGFRFVEFQMRLRGNLHKTWETDGFDYVHEPLSGGDDLAAVLEIASSIFEHDRISRDPFFAKWGSRNISGERYRRYVMKAAQSPKECVYKLVSRATGEIVGFDSHRILDSTTALLLVGGVKSEYKSSGLGAVNDYFGLNELRRKGIRHIFTHVSGANYPILNLEIRGIGFRVVSSAIVMRKVYSGGEA